MKTQTRTYLETIDAVVRAEMTAQELNGAVRTISFIYGKTEESIRTSMTVKVLQLQALKTIEERGKS